MMFPRVEGNMYKNTNVIIFLDLKKKYFGIILIGYSCPIRLVSTYIVRAIQIRLLGRFHPDSF